MKFSTLLLASALALTACGTTKKSDSVQAPEITAIGNQKLTSNFRSEEHTSELQSH